MNWSAVRRLVLLCTLLFGLTGCGYNDMQSQDEAVNAAWSEVLNQYQRRADLIPNLLSVVKGYAEHEQTVLEAVTLARSQAQQATAALKNAPESDNALQSWGTAQSNLSHALRQLMVVNERYPELKSQALFQGLSVQLEGTENRIAVARGRYIKAVERYNVTVRQFPASLTAKVMGYSKKHNYLPDEATTSTQAPRIDFSPARAH